MINLAHYYRQTKYLGELLGLLCLDSWPHEHHLLVIKFATFATKAYCLIWCFFIPSVSAFKAKALLILFTSVVIILEIIQIC